jgi:hypothetical protein
MRMTDSRRDETALDAAIDRAVRDLMSVDPPADLRDRVLAEISGVSTRAALWPRFALASVALAVAVAIAFKVFQPASPASPPETTIAGTRAQPAQDVPAAPPPTPTLPKASPRATAVRTPATEDRPIQAASIDSAAPIGAEPMPPVARLKAIELIDIPRLETAQIGPAPLSLTPITIEPIENSPPIVR